MERDKKILKKFDFCSQTLAHLVVFFATESAENAEFIKFNHEDTKYFCHYRKRSLFIIFIIRSIVEDFYKVSYGVDAEHIADFKRFRTRCVNLYTPVHPIIDNRLSL